MLQAGCGGFGGYHDGSGVEWKVWGAPPTCAGPTAANVSKAWSLLVQAASDISPEHNQPFNYDVVNTGREVLAQIITTMEQTLTGAVQSGDKTSAMQTGEALLEAYTDLDELVGCDWSFLIGPWIADAKKWANASDAPENYYEWMARSQVSTWWPVAPADAAKQTKNFTSGPPLDGVRDARLCDLCVCVRVANLKGIPCISVREQALERAGRGLLQGSCPVLRRPGQADEGRRRVV